MEESFRLSDEKCDRSFIDRNGWKATKFVIPLNCPKRLTNLFPLDLKPNWHWEMRGFVDKKNHHSHSYDA